jgi:hypothetical protein
MTTPRANKTTLVNTYNGDILNMILELKSYTHIMDNISIQTTLLHLYISIKCAILHP